MSSRRRHPPKSEEASRAERALADIPEAYPRPLLQALHLLTRDGALNADARRKLKQIEHLLRTLDPAISDALTRFPEPVMVDCGAGKSSLGLLLAATRLRPAGRGRVIAVESRAELCERGRLVAQACELTQIEFQNCKITEVRERLPARVHLVTALHACDTATDEAIALALAVEADHVALVPCCQADLARQLAALGTSAQSTPHTELPSLYRHPWHRREFGSHLTNVLRALTLEAHGYQVTVTELAGFEHTLKNELILARRVHRVSHEARARLTALEDLFGVRLPIGPIP